MKYSAQYIANIINGKVDGDPQTEIDNVSKIEEGIEGTLSFLANPKYEKYIYTTQSSIVIVNHDFKPSSPVKATLIRVQDAYQAFASLLEIYEKKNTDDRGIHTYSFIDDTATLGKDVYVGSFTYIGKQVKIGDHVKIYPQVYIGENVEIKEYSILYPGVKVHRDCKIGSHCIINYSAVIGGDGFGFAPQADSYKKVPQTGNVILEDHVEIGANTTIDRATLGSTVIRRGVKLDNLIQVAHNVEIDENTVIAAQTGISGSTKIGKNCMIAGQVGIVGHITIADDVKIAAQSGIGKSIMEKGTVVQGSPAFHINSFKKSYIFFKQLPELLGKIRSIESEIEKLKSKTG